MSHPPPSKRLRTEEDEITRSPLVWYDDGSIILQAQTTQFKCHRGILAKYSVVFRDLFSLATPEGEELVEGCPVLKVSDTAVDVGYFLRAIYDVRNHAVLVALPFPVVSAMLRLGRKYDIVFLQEDAIHRLSTTFPATLDAYVSLTENPSQALVDMSSEASLQHFFEAISLARDHGLQKIQASAYFILASSPELAQTFGLQAAGPGSAVLSSEDHQTLTTVMWGHISSHNSLLNDFFGWVRSFDVVPGCSAPGRCNVKMANWVFAGAFNGEPKYELLHTSRQKFVNCYAKNGLCGLCIIDAMNHNIAGKNMFWNKIPSLFGMPPWEELKNDI